MARGHWGRRNQAIAGDRQIDSRPCDHIGIRCAECRDHHTDRSNFGPHRTERHLKHIDRDDGLMHGRKFTAVEIGPKHVLGGSANGLIGR